MQGRVIKIDEAGIVLSAADGNRYTATFETWGKLPRNNGITVDFEPVGRFAQDICLLIEQSKSNTSRGIYALLAFFFGFLGVHDFYRGSIVLGFVHLLGAFILGLITAGFWLVIHAMIIVVQMLVVTKDANGRPMR